MSTTRAAAAVTKLALAIVIALSMTSGSIHAGANLVVNGDFEQGFVPDGSGDSLPLGWMKWEGRQPPEVSTIRASALNGPSRAGSSSLHWARTDGRASGDRSAVSQNLSIDATAYAGLVLSVDVRVSGHNLEAGGWVVPSFEWPVMVEIWYMRASDPLTPQLWRHGWYLDPPGDSVSGPVHDVGYGIIPTFDDTPVPAGTWVTTTFDLTTELPDLGEIVQISVGGSGWDFEGRIDNIELVGAASWKGAYANYAPGGMPDFDQKQDRWAYAILCGPNLVSDTVADVNAVQLIDPGQPCSDALAPVVGGGPDDTLQTYMQGDDEFLFDSCAPAAVANCLWWFDSKYADPAGTPCDGPDTYDMVTAYPAVPDDHCEWNVNDMATPPGGTRPDVNTAYGELIEDLAWRMDTHGQRTGDDSWGAGTTVANTYDAVQQYLEEKDLDDDYIVQLVKSPSYAWIAEEIARSQDLILFLAFGQYCNGDWSYIGGHAVTTAGIVPDEAAPICLSDPFFDLAEAGGAGRVLPEGIAHTHVGWPEEFHNDASFVSHDCYAWQPGFGPYGDVELAGYARPGAGQDTQCADVAHFAAQNVWDPDDASFHPEPCDPLCTVRTYVAWALEISPFYWKAGDWVDYAPSGVPDFDQRQDDLQCAAYGAWSHGGPTAVANSLWWFDSKFETSPVAPPTVNDNYSLVESGDALVDDHDAANVKPLIEDLAARMNTDHPALSPCGTLATEMETGVQQWLADAGLQDDYFVELLVEPTFDKVAAEVGKSQDVVLLLGFWEDQEGTLERVGGHYVTVAGVNTEERLIAFSDPYRDATEAGIASGRVLGVQPREWMKIEFPVPGFYIISLPRVVISPSITDWRELLTALMEAGLQPAVVLRWNTAIDDWESGNFPIDPLQGEAYAVYVENPGTLLLEGVDLTSEIYLPGIGMGSASGTSVISLPFSSGLETADDLIAAIGPDVVSVSRATPGGALITRTPYSGTNFSIVPGEGYRVQMFFSTLYTPFAPLHDDAQNVSHDIWEATPQSAPEGSWGPAGYASWLRYDGMPNFECQNLADLGQPCAPHQGGPVLTMVERALEVSPCIPDQDGDGLRADCDDDCDDDNPDVYPGAPQICDGLNNDCYDPSWPEPLPDDTDDDGDGYSTLCENDCDDGEPSVYPGAPQICDGLNNDCDHPLWPTPPPNDRDDDGDGFPPGCGAGDCDDSDPELFPGQEWYADCDDDGVARQLPVFACDELEADSSTPCLDAQPPDGGWTHTEAEDCDDEDPSKYPQLWYADCDGDGFARPAPLLACDLTEADAATPCVDSLAPDGGWLHNEGLDCDDEDPAVLPTTPEVIGDGIDQNCDGVDDCYQDFDDDGYGSGIVIPDGDLDCTNASDPTSDVSGDCNDADPTEFPGQVWYADCDGDTFARAASVTACAESEADGITPCSDFLAPDGGWRHTPGIDCDDEDSMEFPGQIWYADCDDDGFARSSAITACNESDANVATPCGDGQAPDGGWLHTAGADCNDDDPLEFPGQDWYADCDDDTFPRSTAVTVCSHSEANAATPCFDEQAPDGGWTHASGTDCDDDDPLEFPGQVWYADCDGDAWGRDGSVTACDAEEADALTPCVDAQPPDGSWAHASGTDCDDEATTVYPGAAQLCDGINNDCDDGSWPTAPAGENDDDGDLYVECAPWVGPGGGILGGDDCDDTDPTIYPGAPELCDNKDNDCNTIIDDGWYPPGAVVSLRVLSDKQGLQWSAEATADRYDIVKGDLTAMRSSHGNFTSSLDSCLEEDSADVLSADTAMPASGNGFYYVVRAEKGCKTGSYDSGYSSQNGDRDAEILASPQSCPEVFP